MSRSWTQLYRQTDEVIVGYGAIVVYYVKAYNSSNWTEIIGEEEAQWTTLHVLQQIVQQRLSLDAAGAEDSLYDYALQLRSFFVNEPISMEEQMKFHSIATHFMELLPFEDPFPIELDEKPDDRNRQLRKLCGVFYNIARKLDLPMLWFRHYAMEYKKSVSQRRQPSRKRGQPEDEDTEDGTPHANADDLYQRHGLVKRAAKRQARRSSPGKDRRIEQRSRETQAATQLDETPNEATISIELTNSRDGSRDTS